MGSITKAPIGTEDVNFKDSGASRQTFTRDDSTGRPITLNRLDAKDVQFRFADDEVDSLVDGALLVVHSSHYADLNTAISALGSTEVTMIVSDVFTVTGTAVVPSTMHVVVRNGGSFANGSNTIAFNGPFTAGLYKIFDGTGSITLGRLAAIAYPQWWGATGLGVIDEQLMLEAACDSIRAVTGNVRITADTVFRIASQVDVSGISLTGVDKITSNIFVDFAGVGLAASATQYFQIARIGIKGIVGGMTWDTGAITAGSIGLEIDAAHNHEVRNCHFHTLETGLLIKGAGFYGMTLHNLFQNNTKQIEIASDDATGPPNEMHILYNTITGGTVPAPFGTGITFTGTAANKVDGIQVVGNGIENHAVAEHYKLAIYTRHAWNRYESNTTFVTYDTDEATDNLDSLVISGGSSFASIQVGQRHIATQNTPPPLLISRAGTAIAGLQVNHTDATKRLSLEGTDDLGGSLIADYGVWRWPAGKGMHFVDDTNTEVMGISAKNLRFPITTNSFQGNLTLDANSATTVFSNTAVTAASAVMLFPRTANAGLDLAAGMHVDVANNVVGTSFQIDHPNNANADKVFVYIMFN